MPVDGARLAPERLGSVPRGPRTPRGTGAERTPRLDGRRPAVERRPSPMSARRCAMVALGVLASVALLPVGASGAAPRPFPRARHAAPGPCPWVAASRQHRVPPAALAAEVVSRMTLAQEAAFVVLRAGDGYENINTGVPQLCIPPLTLSDGPNGVANRTPGATQLPASIGLAATFTPRLAFAYGVVEGEEARRKGIDVVQGPELNLARVPVSGRIFEAYGEDPVLAAVMGVQDVDGIQSTGVMADAKHFTAYNEETARLRLAEVVSRRALVELYDAPFAAVVEKAHVASLMCAYGVLNGVNDCASPLVYDTLASWRFGGFVRSDLRSVARPAAAFAAGLSLIKPGSPQGILRLVARHGLSRVVLDRAVARVLTEMFAYGLIAHPRALAIDTPAVTPGHLATARLVAERSMVLLKDRGGVLPLARRETIAVIGTDAADPMSAGFGSAHVLSATLGSPLTALRALAGRRVVSYQPGGPRLGVLAPLTGRDLASGAPLPASPLRRPSRTREPGKQDIDVVSAHNVTRQVLTATAPREGPGWSRWSAVLRVRRSGLYELSLTETGDTWLRLGGRPLLSMPGLHGHAFWSTTVPLVAGRRYALALQWFAVAGQHAPRIGLADVSPAIAAAVRAARRARVAVVFASDWTSEGVDRPSLSLPGDANVLIAAVARANPRTVVVLNTGGAVLMPWLRRVAAVVEAWYPGVEGGAATAAVLSGRVDPAGRLPLSFPASAAPAPLASPAAYPGVDGVVHYREGLDIGYRWYLAHRVRPLFPFGFGLSYTSFRLSDASARRRGGAVLVRVRVTNTGRRRGADVVQAYLAYPVAAGEPPEQLRGFERVALAPHRSAQVELRLPAAAFLADLGGRLRVLPGTYRVGLGPDALDLPIQLTTPAP